MVEDVNAAIYELGDWEVYVEMRYRNQTTCGSTISLRYEDARKKKVRD